MQSLVAPAEVQLAQELQVPRVPAREIHVVGRRGGAPAFFACASQAITKETTKSQSGNDFAVSLSLIVERASGCGSTAECDTNSFSDGEPHSSRSRASSATNATSAS